MTLRVTAWLGPALSSFSNRVFLACTLLAALSLGVASYFVNEQATAAAESELHRGLTEAGRLVGERHADRTDTFRRLARVVADLPKLKAAVETADAPTVQPLAAQYRSEVNADMLLLTGRQGEVLGSAGRNTESVRYATAAVATDGEASLFHPIDGGVLQIVSVPIVLDGEIPDTLGRLVVGVVLNDARAAELRDITGSDIAFAAGGHVLASSLPADARDALTPVLGSPAIATVVIGGEEFLAVARPLDDAGSASAIVLRSRTERLQFLSTIRMRMLGVLVVTVLAATILSYGVARTMTRPLTELADYLARVEKDAAQQDRLSALGRLSTVVAHEIRNPLMIIKAALVSLRRDRVSTADLHDAANDIEEETDRLNRIVSEVLDFARPIRFDLTEANVNDLCRASAAAAWAGQPAPNLVFDLDPCLPPIITDAERLRTALVNLLTNAKHAVTEVRPPQPAVTLMTRQAGDRIVIVVRDCGVGISAEEMRHIFDPFFTTRRTGTGLGLPIAKNIIEGLHGSISVASTPEIGTEIRVEFPCSSEART